MSDFHLFDSNCVVGRHLKWAPGQPCCVNELLAEMDHYGIDEALIVDCLGRENHPADGNVRVLEAASASPRIHPAWSALPHGPDDEQPRPDVFLDEMRRNKVGAVFLYPNQFRFSLSDWCVDEFLEPLAEARVPVVINPVEIGPRILHSADGTDWDAVVSLCRRLPDLPVIVSERRIRRSQRMLYKAFDACENLHVDLSGYWLHRGIEFIARRWGPNRMIFGTNWPTFGPHMTLATLACADISDEDKQLIGGGNMRRLIRWCEPEHPEIESAPPADEFVHLGRTGRGPQDMIFHDCHGHLGPHSAHYHLPDCASLGSIVADMDRLSVSKVCVFSFTGVFSDERPGNDIVAEAVRLYPDRFLGFTMLNPHRGPEVMLRELERGHAMGLRGVKLIPYYQGYPEEGPNIDVACQWADEHGQFILNHHWGSPEQVERLVRTYPNACFIAGHTTTAYSEIMKRYENLYVCSCPLIGPRTCVEVVEAIGADRFLFGSDLEDLPIAWGLGPILFAHISPEEKRLILGENLRRLLDRYSRS
ncbi:MAG: amidohydrolase family protein [Planctomycetota bacterium]|nr:amidohydrolase family protein [Planctomycetota bacterium]